MGGKRSQQAGQTPVTASTAGYRSRMTAPLVAVWSLGVLIILLIAVTVPLGAAARYAGNSYDESLLVFIALLPMAPVGFVVARRQPGNPIGWMFLALTALLMIDGVGTDYA